MNRIPLSWLAAAALASPTLAHAQSADAPAPQDHAAAPAAITGQPPTSLIAHNADLAGSYEIDTAIPAAPGFAVIGLSPTDVIDPGQSRVTFASVVNYLDAHSDMKSGLALGGTPYWWFNRTTLSDYRATGGGLERIFARTEVSAGYVRGDSGEPSRLGLGFSTELLNSGDYRLNTDIYKCAVTAYRKLFKLGESDSLGRDKATLDRLLGEAEAELAKPIGQQETFEDPELKNYPSAAQRTHWKLVWVGKASSRQAAIAEADSAAYLDAVKTCQNNFFASRVSWTLAGGVALRHLNGDTTSDGGSLWTAYRRPLGLTRSLPTPNYISLFGRYDFDKAAEAGGAPTIQTYDKAVIALILGYEAPKWKLSGQVGYERINYHGAGAFADDSYGFYSVSYNYNVSANVWLEFLAGRRNDRVSKNNGTDSYVVLNVHWAPRLRGGEADK